MTYAEKLKDPRWQKRRLEILERDSSRCVNCSSEERLEVHHIRYFPKREPWGYDNRWLVTLCRDCHEAEQRRSDYEIELLEALRDKWVFAETLHELAEDIRREVPTRAREGQVFQLLALTLSRAGHVVKAMQAPPRVRKFAHPDTYCRPCAMGLCPHGERWEWA